MFDCANVGLRNGLDLSNPADRLRWLQSEQAKIRGADKDLLAGLIESARSHAAAREKGASPTIRPAMPPPPAVSPASKSSREDARLRECLDRVNGLYFKGLLPEHLEIRYGEVVACVACYRPSTHQIVIGRRADTRESRGLTGTWRHQEDSVLHEAMHAWLRSIGKREEPCHGRFWVAECARIAEMLPEAEKRPGWRSRVEEAPSTFPSRIRPHEYYHTNY